MRKWVLLFRCSWAAYLTYYQAERLRKNRPYTSYDVKHEVELHVWAKVSQHEVAMLKQERADLAEKRAKSNDQKVTKYKFAEKTSFCSLFPGMKSK